MRNLIVFILVFLFVIYVLISLGVAVIAGAMQASLADSLKIGFSWPVTAMIVYFQHLTR